MGLGPGGQPIDANQLNRGGGGMGNMGPGGNQSEDSKTLELLQLRRMTNNRSCCRNGWHGICKHGRRRRRRTDGGRYITFSVSATPLQLTKSMNYLAANISYRLIVCGCFLLKWK